MSSCQMLALIQSYTFVVQSTGLHLLYRMQSHCWWGHRTNWIPFFLYIKSCLLIADAITQNNQWGADGIAALESVPTHMKRVQDCVDLCQGLIHTHTQMTASLFPVKEKKHSNTQNTLAYSMRTILHSASPGYRRCPLVWVDWWCRLRGRSFGCLSQTRT